jgi:hypothetical protein
MPSDAEMFGKLLRTTAKVLDQDDPKKTVFEDIVAALDEKEATQ